MKFRLWKLSSWAVIPISSGEKIFHDIFAAWYHNNYNIWFMIYDNYQMGMGKRIMKVTLKRGSVWSQWHFYKFWIRPQEDMKG